MTQTTAGEIKSANGNEVQSFRQRFADAARFWEPRRILYNLLLVAVVGIWVVATWPHFRPAMKLSALLAMCVLGLLANICYCAAYVADLAVWAAHVNLALRRYRWTLWVVGTVLAIVFANYWIADEIYPDVN